MGLQADPTSNILPFANPLKHLGPFLAEFVLMDSYRIIVWTSFLKSRKMLSNLYNFCFESTSYAVNETKE